MNIKEIYRKLVEHDLSMSDTIRRYRSTQTEINRIKEARAISAADSDDTRSFDVNLEILYKQSNEHAFRLNWVCRDLGLGVPFQFYT